MSAKLKCWIWLVVCVAPFPLRAAVTETILSLAVTNYTGYVIDADADTGDAAYDRESLRVQSRIQYVNTATFSTNLQYNLTFRLLDTNGVAQPIRSGVGTNTSHTIGVSFTVAASSSRIVTNSVALRPTVRLDPYNQYTVELSLSRGGLPTGDVATDGPRTYYHFTNHISGDTSFNIIPTLENASYTRTYLVKTVPGKQSFSVSVLCVYRRYDDISNAANPAVSAPFVLDYELRNAATDALVPLRANRTVFARTISGYIAGAPPEPREFSSSRTINIEPADGVPFDPVTNRYKVVVTISLTNDPAGSAVTIGNTLATAGQRLLPFNGRLYFGAATLTPIETMFSSLANDPPDMGTSGNFLRSQLVVNNNSGFVVGKLSHTYGDGVTLLSVLLGSDGNAAVSSGSVILNGPIPDFDEAAGIRFQRQTGTLGLTSIGGIASIDLTLPTGFGYRPNTNSQVLESDLTFGDVPLNQALAPRIDLTYGSGPTFYACEESKALWIPASAIVWNVNQGQFTVTPSGSLIYVRGAALSQLEAAGPLTVDPAAMGFKRANDQYLRFADTVNGAPITVRPDPNGAAWLSIDFNLLPSASGFRTHFPYDVWVKWTGAGSMVINDDLVDPTNSHLTVVEPLALSYARACPGCGESNSVNTIQMTPDASELRFTRDGGLMAQGTMASPVLLRWGYIPDPKKYAQTVSNFTASGFHMPGIFLRGDQTNEATAAPEARPGALLLTGVGPALDYLERPSMAGDDSYVTEGEADYAGLNFRADVGSAKHGISTLAGTTLPSYPVTMRSKYYARRGGVSGVHEAQPDTFPSGARLMDYEFRFSNYGLSYLDSQNKDSRTDGQVEVPYPSDITNEFRRLIFLCNGGLTTAEIANPGETAQLKYWDATITPRAVQFERDESCVCDPSQGFLVLGVSTSIAHVEEALHGELGFLPSGNLITAAVTGDGGAADCAVSGFNSRLPLPSRIVLKGPGQEKYTFTPVCSAYFNNYDDHSLAPGAGFGFVNLAGTLDVPFFRDLQVHMHTSANGANSFAPIQLMGGWPDHGYGTATENFFTQADDFDRGNRGFPEDAGVTVASYRTTTNEQYHVRAQQNWFGVVNFDYPLNWSSTRRTFTSTIPKADDLFVLNVESQVKYLSPEHAELAFGAQYDALPQLNLANLAFNAIDDITGVSHALSLIIDVSPITTGLNRLERLLSDQLHGFFDEILDSRLDSILNSLKTELAELDPTGPGFSDDVLAALDNHFLGEAGETIEAKLKAISGSVADGYGVLDQVDGYLSDVESALETVSGVLAENDNHQRTIGSQIIGALLGELAADFAGPVADAAVNDLLTKADPTLDQISAIVLELKTNISQLRMQFDEGEEFAEELRTTIEGAADEIREFIEQARDDAHDYIEGLRARAVASHFGDEYDMEEIGRVIRQKIEDRLFGSDLAASLQETIRHRLYDLNAAIREGIDSAFQQFNSILRDVISQTLAELDNSINGVLGKISSVMGAGKINGYAHINGDALRELRLDGHFQLSVPDNMELNAYLLIRELDSEGTPGCPPDSHGTATEVTLGATDVDLDWISPDLRANVGTKFTFESDGTLLGLAGNFEITGGLNFETFTVDYLGAAIAFGEFENYLSAAAGISFGSYRGFGGIYFGKTCSLDPIRFWDPEVARLLGDPPFTGAYGYVEVWIPISEVYLGVPASCMFRIDAGVGAGVGYFVEGPTYIGKLFAGVSGEALCLVSIRGDVTMIGVKRGDDFRFSGNGRIKGKAGSCPLCVKFSKRVNLTYENGGWDVDY